MSEEKQLRAIQKMIKAGMYDEARSALLSIDHPTANKWLKRLNQISPPKTKIRSRPQKSQRKEKLKTEDYLVDDVQPTANSKATAIVIIAVLIGIGALLVGGAFMLTQSSDVELPIATDNTGCGAQTWVNEVDGSFNDIYRYNLWEMIFYNPSTGLLQVDEDLRTQQIADLEDRLKGIEDSTPPDCVAGVRYKLVEVYEAQILATKILDINNPIQAFGLFGKTLRLMKEAGTELIELGAQFRRIDGASINQVVDPECPAYEYVTRTMYVDNQFVVMLLVDPQVGSLDAFYSLIRDLAQQYYRVLDDPNVPPCLWEVRNQFVEMIDGMQRALEAATGADAYGFEVHFTRFTDALDQFYVEIEKVGLDPVQFGGLVVIREE